MKNCLSILVLVVLFGCAGKQQPDMIGLTLVKSQDTVSRSRSAGGILPEEKNSFPGIFVEEIKRIPAWKDSRLYFCEMDFPQLLFQAYKAGRVDQEKCMYYFNAWGKDTSAYSLVECKSYFALLTGEAEDGLKYFAADENGNFDFTDDRVQLLSDSILPVKVVFERFDGNRPVLDSSWIVPKIIPNYGDYLFLESREKTEGSFFLEGENYTCRIIPSGMQYQKDRTLIEFISSDTVQKCAMYQYVKLGTAYYKTDSIADDGRYLRLIRIKDTTCMAGTQVGFPPLPFSATTTAGHTFRFPEDFKGKYVLLDFWSTGCGPCRQEIRDVYPTIYERYKEQGFEILGIADDNTAELAEFSQKIPLPWPVVAGRDQQEDLKKLYNINGFPTLFLISPEGRIIYEGGILRGNSLNAILEKIFKPEN